MKPAAVLTTFVCTVLAAPGGDCPSTHVGDGICPGNRVQPDGKLPSDLSWVTSSLVMRISASEPDTVFPVSDWAEVTPGDVCTIFNLDLDVAETQGKVCNLVFDFPSQEQAGDEFRFQGSGSFLFTGYAVGAGAVDGETTYSNPPAAGPSPPSPPSITPGNSYVIYSAPCGIPADTPSPATVSGSLCSNDTTFKFRQSDDRACPMGFFNILTDA